MEDKEYIADLKEMVKIAKEMYIKGEYKSPEYGELCAAVVKLIESSDFGAKETESELELKVKQDFFDEVMDDSFDGTAMQFLKMCASYLGRFGSLSMVPYSKGLASRSAKVKFKPKEHQDVPCKEKK
jgi:hypothetical protein